MDYIDRYIFRNLNKNEVSIQNINKTLARQKSTNSKTTLVLLLISTVMVVQTLEIRRLRTEIAELKSKGE